jgi:predicted lipoprotein
MLQRTIHFSDDEHNENGNDDKNQNKYNQASRTLNCATHCVVTASNSQEGAIKKQMRVVDAYR